MQQNTLYNQLEFELQARNELLNHSTLICITDKIGVILYVNDRYCETTQYKRSELIGKKHYLFKHPELPQQKIEEISNTLITGNTWSGELIDIKKNGDTIQSLATVTPVKNEHNSITRYIWSILDITPYKQSSSKSLQTSVSYSDKHILENVKYAKRIQQAILPNDIVLRNIFSNSFVFYKAQNKVSGDFYWYKKIDKNNNLIILGDSTGHGVSASYISMLSLSKLFNLVDEKKILSPSSIIAKQNTFLKKILAKSNTVKITETVECIVLNYDEENKMLKYKAQGIRGLILRGNEIIELERQKEEVCDTSENQLVSLQSADRVYIFSDGCVDQFGSVGDKKFTIKRLKQFIYSSKKLSLTEQKAFFNNTLNNWMGSCEQTDDMTMIGFEVE
ncbi:MAG: SpoIIE family protein phosphatase [Flavobacteriales bacterium]